MSMQLPQRAPIRFIEATQRRSHGSDAPRTAASGVLLELHRRDRSGESGPRPLGWWDLRGRLDRDLACDELSDLFEHDDEPRPDRPAHHVTLLEFLAVAALYSDVRLARTRLVIESGADDDSFRGVVMRDLARALVTQSGRTLLRQKLSGEQSWPLPVRLMPADAASVAETSEEDGDPAVRYAAGESRTVPGDVALLHELTWLFAQEDSQQRPALAV